MRKCCSLVSVVSVLLVLALILTLVLSIRVCIIVVSATILFVLSDCSHDLAIIL